MASRRVDDRSAATSRRCARARQRDRIVAVAAAVVRPGPREHAAVRDRTATAFSIARKRRSASSDRGRPSAARDDGRALTANPVSLRLQLLAFGAADARAAMDRLPLRAGDGGRAARGSRAIAAARARPRSPRRSRIRAGALPAAAAATRAPSGCDLYAPPLAGEPRRRRRPRRSLEFRRPTRSVASGAGHRVWAGIYGRYVYLFLASRTATSFISASRAAAVR